MDRNLKKHWKTIVSVLVLLIASPILVNFMLSFSTPLTFGDDWHGFFGSYFGTILGGLFAYIIARIQIAEQRETERKQRIEAQRSYICIEDIKDFVGLKSVPTSKLCKIIETEDYSTLNGSSNYIIPYYKILHYGQPDIILNAEIVIDFKDENDKSRNVKYALGNIYKDCELYLPMYIREVKEIHLRKIVFTYITIGGEKIKYIQDFEGKVEEYWTNDYNPTKFLTLELKNANWIIKS